MNIIFIATDVLHSFHCIGEVQDPDLGECVPCEEGCLGCSLGMSSCFVDSRVEIVVLFHTPCHSFSRDSCHCSHQYSLSGLTPMQWIDRSLVFLKLKSKKGQVYFLLVVS